MDDLVEQALAISLEQLGTGASLPFALVVGPEGRIECLTIVTDRSDKAAWLGRRLVRERSASARAYAIATDAFVRRGDERLDAVVVEAARRGEAFARVTAQPYAVGGGRATRLGEPVSLGERPSELEPWDPWSLDWGPITPDVYSESQRLAVHVVNHRLDSEENVARTIRFVRARVRHHAPHLPPGTSQLVHYDDRGQSIPESTRERLRQASSAAQARFTSEGGR